MKPPEVFARGDFVIIEAEGKRLGAFVALASANGRSLMLFYDGMIGGFVGAMPVLYDDGAWRALNNMPVTLRRAREGEA